MKLFKVGFAFITALILVTGCFITGKNSPKLRISETELGRKLFFDPMLSSDGSVSCASCHKPEFAFADTVAFSAGVGGRLTSRNTPSVMNVTARPYLFWDGRSPSLEDQVVHPIINPNEMGADLGVIIHRLATDEYYRSAFEVVYHHKPNAELLGKAIAAFERTLETADSPFDRFMEGDSSAISISAMRGRDLFVGKAHCFDCHFSPDFTADEFRNIGIFNSGEHNDSGRYYVTHNPDDIGRFKVPGLRNVALTAPYMHNGMFPTLKWVVEYYNQPDLFIPFYINRDPLIHSLNLTEQEKDDLVAFMETLTSDYSYSQP